MNPWTCIDPVKSLRILYTKRSSDSGEARQWSINREVVMAITDWPLAERPREKMLLRGAQNLSDAELLAIFLRTGCKGRTAVDLARELLSEFGSLRALLAADQQRFCQGLGLGTAKYVQLQASLEMARRHLHETLTRGDALASPQDTRRYLLAQLRDYPHEVFAALFLDSRHRVIKYQELFYGTIDGASVYPREVVRRALQYNAAALIFAHNHPSGVAEPSQADRQLTDRLKNALGLVEVRVLDHIVVGDGECVSFAERGWL
jgi:DNA repair protein RadC